MKWNWKKKKDEICGNIKVSRIQVQKLLLNLLNQKCK